MNSYEDNINTETRDKMLLLSLVLLRSDCFRDLQNQQAASNRVDEEAEIF